MSRKALEQGVDDGHAWKLSAFAEEKLRQDIKKIIALAGSGNKA